MGTQIKVATIPKCDLCKPGAGEEAPNAYADALIPGGGWADVCRMHFVNLGCVLGTGHGQKYVKADPDAPAPERDPEPSMDQLEEWMFDGECEATDGCTVEPDGTCEHGYKSWLLEMGLI